MKIIGKFFNVEHEIEEIVYLIAPTMNAAKFFMDKELKNFKLMYEDVPFEKWKARNPDGTMCDFYRTSYYYDYNVDCKYGIVVVFDEDNFNDSEAIELDSNGGRA